FGQAGDANLADEQAIECEWYSAADEINLPWIHVHDAEISIGSGLIKLPQGLRGLPVKSRGERLAFGKANVLQGGAVHAIRGHHVSGVVDHGNGHAHVALASIGNSALNDGARFGERELRRGVRERCRRRSLRERRARCPQQYHSYYERSRQWPAKQPHIASLGLFGGLLPKFIRVPRRRARAASQALRGRAPWPS